MKVKIDRPAVERSPTGILFEIASTFTKNNLRIISCRSTSQSDSGLFSKLVCWSLQHFELKPDNGLLLTFGCSIDAQIDLLAGLNLMECRDSTSCDEEFQSCLSGSGPFQIKTIFLPNSLIRSKAKALQVMQPGNADFLRDEDRQVCYRMIETLDFDLVTQEQKCLADEENIPSSVPYEPSDGSWQMRLSKENPLNIEDVPSSASGAAFDRLIALKSQRDKINEEARDVLKRFIAESFSTSINEEFQAIEPFEVMRNRAEAVRNWLKEFDSAMINPRNGLPCQPFAEQTRKLPRYTLSPLGAERPAKTVDKRVVGSALLHPQLTIRPDPVQHAFGRSR